MRGKIVIEVTVFRVLEVFATDFNGDDFLIRQGWGKAAMSHRAMGDNLYVNQELE